MASLLYVVECSYTDPVTEADWNSYYNKDKLSSLLSVTGFRSSQRFVALSAGVPKYLAVHTIRSGDVLHGREYREHGGGGFGDWQQWIADWHRNVFDGIDYAPHVVEGQLLLSSDVSDDTLRRYCREVHRLVATALDLNPRYRWIGVAEDSTEQVRRAIDASLAVYRPITPQRKPVRG